MRDNEQFVRELVKAVPQLEVDFATHLAEMDELLPHVFMGDVSRFAIDQVRRCEEGSEAACDVLAELFAVLERGAAEGAEEVQEMIAVSFLENVVSELHDSQRFLALLGPALWRDYLPVLDCFGP